MNILETLGVHRGIFLAPMEDVTDISFRTICKEFGADMVYTEFVNADGLVRSKKPTKARMKLRIGENERPIGIQIYGGNLDTMREAAKIAQDAQPDVLDINAGCWVKNIAMRGAGAGLLRDIPTMVQMAASVVKEVQLPVTVKTRLGWDSDSIRIVEVAKRLEDVGIRALTVHCRTREQGHCGEADWSWIPRIKEAVKIPIILNGDIRTAEDVRRAFDETEADAVMIARGAISNPWIFREAKHYLTTSSHLPSPTFEERIHTAIKHLRYAVEIKGERRAVLEMRKYYLGYFKNLPENRFLRQMLMKPATLSEAEDILFRFLDYGYGLIAREEKSTETRSNLTVPLDCSYSLSYY